MTTPHTESTVTTPPVAPAPVEPQPLVFTAPEPLHVASGCDTATYRRAKEIAEREGRQLIIDPRPAPPPPVYAPGTLFLKKGCSHAEYKTAKARAEAAGVPLVFLES